MIVDCAVYENGARRGGDVPLSEAYEAGRESGNGFVWIGLHEPSREELESVRAEFDLHELAVEDAIKAHQRPKLEKYGDSLFVVLKTAHYNDEAEEVEFGEILLFIGATFVVSVRHGVASALHDVRLGVEKRADLLRCGPGAVLHVVVDRVVDDYAPVIEGLDNDIEEVEAQVFSPVFGSPAERIYKLKREVLAFHRATAPLVDPLQRLLHEQGPLVHEEIRSYFGDVHDHLLRVVDEVNNASALLSSVLDANLAQVSMRQNEDVRKISAWAAIAAANTLIAGVYGMNFEHMPELTWTLGYPLALSVMLVVGILLYWRFRRAGWL